MLSQKLSYLSWVLIRNEIILYLYHHIANICKIISASFWKTMDKRVLCSWVVMTSGWKSKGWGLNVVTLKQKRWVWVKIFWPGSGQFFVARVRSGQPSLVWVWKISPKNHKIFNFCLQIKTNLIGSGQKVLGSMFYRLTYKTL